MRNAYVFESLAQVPESAVEWLQSYNEKRPHEALAELSPALYQVGLGSRSSPLIVSL